MRDTEHVEPNRVAGVPVARGRRYEEAPQHAMGVPLAWEQPVGEHVLRAVLHPLCALRERAHRRAIDSLLDP